MNCRNMNRTLIALAAATLSMSALAEAPTAGGPEARKGGGWMLQHYDADGDGTISLQEFQAAGDAMFARLDTDGDGRLSADELAAAGRGWGHPERAGKAEHHHGHRSHRGLARMDTDGDGYVTRAEFDAARLARFSALDVNGNGVIDADEVPARGDRKGYGKRAR